MPKKNEPILRKIRVMIEEPGFAPRLLNEVTPMMKSMSVKLPKAAADRGMNAKEMRRVADAIIVGWKNNGSWHRHSRYFTEEEIW